ncbi:RAD3-like DEAD/DEAH box helicase [Ilumatobacter fluminis]|uniref:RAD3-like DEAD/DEAH box helicase n=2 Tax=Ilumatobacter fluminis TaxID=467091 RepID=A0A4R7HUF9_9ACTN|nr:RAD3-like DEAD/DEAH box helicase [Ilumatobacter fluminis]
MLLDELVAAGLVHERGLRGSEFRTRMAETVRLARHLRQWFHGPRSDWRTAKTLVSDMRFLARHRSVPERNVTSGDLSERLGALLGDDWTSAHQSSIEAVLRGRSVSQFQARASEQLLGSVGAGGGTCVTAGTGAGKTLAFYLPALVHTLSVPGSPGVPRIVAIYPRVELLRDQLASLLTTLQDLASRGVASPSVGVLYGASPRDREDAERNRRRGWRRSPNGLVSPIVSCLNEDCGGSLVWPDGEPAGRLLRCESCGSDVTSLVFDRKSLLSAPPEIVFTTTEMINRSLGAPRMRRVLVGTPSAAPDFILLDEIHTYSGTHGAQVANLLRRWRAEMSAPSHVVGLSATLADPVGFFSELIGADAGNVSVVAPAAAEMRQTGREYFMALRGDPASQTSLLSTTIQTAMLMRRMLDREPGVPSRGAFGTRVFAFTDKLDVANRLHSQLQDAEGWKQGGVDRKPEGSLALLRASGDENRLRDDVGQLWDASEDIGTLSRKVVVDRTTSQDTGVNPSSDVVVATASLEVGFDDPNVGAVIQHKAPRDAAQFLQRRGRAGRDPRMRPWTTVVLSDYGRDRLSFQSYETLFDPQIPASHLPVKNRVILKMQATWWLVDQLTYASGGTPLRSVLESSWGRYPERQVAAATAALAAATDFLTDEGLGRLESGLKRSLALSDLDAKAVLFDPPRAVVTSVLPTIIRRLEAVLGRDRLGREFVWNDPLTDFVPSSLFAPLQTPEVRIDLPSVGQFQPDPEVGPISQTMREFAPGRVSYRFALRGKRERMWVEPPESSDAKFDLDSFCTDFLVLEAPEGVEGAVLQPRSLSLTRPNGRVPDSSYGRWKWDFFWRLNGTPVELDVPARSPWATRVSTLRVMTHRALSPLTVWRVAQAVEIERNMADEPQRTVHQVQFGGRNAAVGFNMDVDALGFDLVLPTELPTDGSPALLRALRTAYFEHLVQTDELIAMRVGSPFLRKWIAELALSAFTTLASEEGGEATTLPEQRMASEMVRAARVVFGSEGQLDDTDEGGRAPALVEDVESALSDTDVVESLARCVLVLSGPLNTVALGWLHERYAATLAAGVVDAIQALCPECDVEELRPDFVVVEEESGPIARIIISEDQPGGTGVIEAAADRIMEDARAFWDLVGSALGPSDGERVDRAIREFLCLCDQGEQLSARASRVRSATSLSEATAAWATLREAMFQAGLPADPTVVSALSTRLLRPGSDARIEALCTELLQQWDSLEESLELEVDLRVFAYLAAGSGEVRQALSDLAVTVDQSPEWSVGQVAGLLWARGGNLRAASLQSYNPYCELPATERLLFEDVIEAAVPAVVFRSDSQRWREELDRSLAMHASAEIDCADELAAAVALRQLMTQPTSVGVLEFYPRVIGVRRNGTGLRLRVDIREAQQ